MEALRLRGIIIPPPPPPPALRHPVKADADLSRQGGGVQSESEYILGTSVKTKCPVSCSEFDVQSVSDNSVEEIIPVSRRMKTVLLRKQRELCHRSGCSTVSVINDASDPMLLKEVGTSDNISMVKVLLTQLLIDEVDGVAIEQLRSRGADVHSDKWRYSSHC